MPALALALALFVPQHPCDVGARLGAEAADLEDVRRWVALGLIAPIIGPFHAAGARPAVNPVLLHGVERAGIPCYEDAYRLRLRDRRTRAAWYGTLAAAAAVGHGHLHEALTCERNTWGPALSVAAGASGSPWNFVPP